MKVKAWESLRRPGKNWSMTSFSDHPHGLMKLINETGQVRARTIEILGMTNAREFAGSFEAFALIQLVQSAVVLLNQKFWRLFRTFGVDKRTRQLALLDSINFVNFSACDVFRAKKNQLIVGSGSVGWKGGWKPQQLSRAVVCGCTVCLARSVSKLQTTKYLTINISSLLPGNNLCESLSVTLTMKLTTPT